YSATALRSRFSGLARGAAGPSDRPPAPPSDTWRAAAGTRAARVPVWGPKTRSTPLPEEGQASEHEADHRTRCAPQVPYARAKRRGKAQHNSHSFQRADRGEGRRAVADRDR